MERASARREGRRVIAETAESETARGAGRMRTLTSMVETPLPLAKFVNPTKALYTRAAVAIVLRHECDLLQTGNGGDEIFSLMVAGKRNCASDAGIFIF